MTRSATILIADDDPSLRLVITTLLEHEGFDVIQAVDGAACLRLNHEHHPDLILLDIMMPHKDGRQVCQQVREVSDVPIIMLTALSEEQEKVDRLIGGADDYVTKPFDNAELVARIRAVLRRSRGIENARRQLYDDGYLQIDFDAHHIYIKGDKVGLSPKEWRLLEYMTRNADRVVPHEVLLQHTWGRGYENEINYLKVCISKLRKKLNDSVRRPRYIHTERDIGYRFEFHN